MFALEQQTSQLPWPRVEQYMKLVDLQNFTIKACILLVVLCLNGCGITQTKYQREYAKVWKELIQTQAWKESLMARNDYGDDNLYASSEEEMVVVDDAKASIAFDNQYETLVSKAYFKIITEAEKADARIAAEYQLLQNKNAQERGSKKYISEITKKYKAHTAMLSGLKSWNIFSENRTGDLDYFKLENKVAIQKMIREGESENTMVNYLIYKLADLYHVEE